MRVCFNSDGSLSPACAAFDDGCEAGDIVPRREVGGELGESVVFRIAFDTGKRVGSLTAELNLRCLGVEQKDRTKEREGEYIGSQYTLRLGEDDIGAASAQGGTNQFTKSPGGG